MLTLLNAITQITCILAIFTDLNLSCKEAVYVNIYDDFAENQVNLINLSKQSTSDYIARFCDVGVNGCHVSYIHIAYIHVY